ncbi:MAG TPA: DmsE family decaheme c-type cytochrome [Usitatibacteraceae bacterium]|nr:DmsE family decaheme c-type cytochrome [Usitatibacteraceae bacterium]
MHHRLAAKLVTACALSLAFLWAGPASAQGAEPVCNKCHEESQTSIQSTAHGAKNDAKGSMCESCHGDAADHVAARGKKPLPNNKMVKATTPDEKSAVCLTCHAGNRQLAFWESGKHAKNDVACSNCHSIHGKNKGPSPTIFTTTNRPIEAEICGSCHTQVRTATMKTSHHPIQEGKVKCSDCHNPHGALSQAMVKHESVNQQCFSCHADKRGPFVFGHPPVEENCLTCHTPHGSSHGKLLSEKVPNVCQDCHTQGRHPTAYYGQNQSWILANGTAVTNASNRLVYRSCLNCHNSVHGSNAPSNRGRYLIR